ncbi:MAG: peptidase S41, partial [Prevotellaceae bacterium]|nr:peptidase S41 [Prevotellaceae bacterium]
MINRSRITATLLLCLSLLGATAQKNNGNVEETTLRKLTIATMAINSLYVDSVDCTKLAEDAIRGMLEKLDPHS